MTHCKVRHFLSCGLPPRQDLYPTSVATARATPSSRPSLRSPATVRRPRGVPHSHTLQTIKVGRRGKQNATTTHMTNSRKQRTSVFRWICQLHSNLSLSWLPYQLQSLRRRRHHSEDSVGHSGNGCVERCMEESPSGHIQQIPTLSSYPNEPLALGC